jgi:hypothetical protein
MPGSYWLVARDKPGLLIAMMRALTGHAYISFEGKTYRDVTSGYFPLLMMV